MAKKIVNVKDKPAEILEFEKIYNVVLTEEKADFSLEKDLTGNVFSLNGEGRVNGISFFNEVVKDVKPLSILNQLEYVNLTRSLIEDISSLPPLPKLKYLYLGGNKIKKINNLLQFPNLIKLIIWSNPIEDFSPIGNLHKLQELYCQDNGIIDLTFIAELKSLTILDLSDNKISDLRKIVNLNKLEGLSLGKNRIKDIQIFENFQNLKSLSLQFNLIKKIPSKVAEKFRKIDFSTEYSLLKINKNILELAGNQLEFPPVSVIELGKETIKNYYETAEQFGHAPLSEGRILFIGDGSSGKSSIIEKVIYNTFQKGREQTNGIRIEHLHLQHPEDKRDLTFHIWDFGGQEIQHAVHKFFFTEGCLYVLVLDNRKEEDPEYWLQQIESLGGKASVLVVFNKQDENAAETADRKYLKEKYPNIVGFYNTSCQSGFGIDDFKNDLETEAVKLRTVNEQFPNNWFKIKKAIEKCTSGSQHYLNYDSYVEICKKNNVENEKTQKLILKYFTTIGAVTWFGDTYLNFLHVLNPAWITQGGYKIITSKKTSHLFGQINISDFNELLQPVIGKDYVYEEAHYGYILSMMKKFDLCYTPDDKNLFIPSAFGKMPKIEYSEFRGESVRTYILQFKDYMPLALLHRYIAKKIPSAFDNNYWYSGIVIKDSESDSLAMVQADKDAKRIYVRIKGESQLGMWEYIRRELKEITSNYANINYNELVALEEKSESTVNYEDLVSHLQARKNTYFHPKLRQDFNVGYLMGLFENKEDTIEKIKKGEIVFRDHGIEISKKLPPFVINILNNNSPTVNTQINTQINIDIDIQVVNNLGSEVKGDAVYLLELLGESNKALNDALQKVIVFADDAKAARNSGDVREKGWGRKLKSVLQTLGNAGEQIKNIQDGGAALGSMFKGIFELANQFNLKDIIDFLEKNPLNL